MQKLIHNCDLLAVWYENKNGPKIVQRIYFGRFNKNSLSQPINLN